MLLHFSIEGQCQASCDAQPAERQNKLEAHVANSCRSEAQTMQHTVLCRTLKSVKKSERVHKSCLPALIMGWQASQKRRKFYITLLLWVLFTWSCKLHRLPNCFPHIAHGNFFTWRWTILMWSERFLLSQYAFPHSSHV